MTTNERRQAIFECLCESRYVKCSNLASAFSVNRTTIYRDVLELSLSYPIYTTKGYHGGIYIDADFASGKLYLSPEQKAVLEKYMPTDANDKKIFEAIINKFQRRR